MSDGSGSQRKRRRRTIVMALVLAGVVALIYLGFLYQFSPGG